MYFGYVTYLYATNYKNNFESGLPFPPPQKKKKGNGLLSTLATSSVPKVTVVERFDCICKTYYESITLHAK